jgi:hypothetical protein
MHRPKFLELRKAEVRLLSISLPHAQLNNGNERRSRGILIGCLDPGLCRARRLE